MSISNTTGLGTSRNFRCRNGVKPGFSCFDWGGAPLASGRGEASCGMAIGGRRAVGLFVEVVIVTGSSLKGTRRKGGVGEWKEFD